MIQESLRVTAQSIISQMLEGHKTFSDLASKYEMSEDYFKQVAARVVNDKDWPRLVKANAKNKALRNRIRKNKIPVPKPELENKQEVEPDPVLSKRKKLVKHLVFINKEIECCEVFKEETKTDSVEATLKLEEVTKEFEEVVEKVKEARKICKLKEEKKQEATQQLESLEKKRESIKEQIKEIDSNIICLVAPGYKGKLPEYGTLISVVPMEGVIVEDVSDVVLISEMTAEDIFSFDSMEDAKIAHEFAKLVLKYFVNDKKYQLLVDNDVLIKLLKKMELIDETS